MKKIAILFLLLFLNFVLFAQENPNLVVKKTSKKFTFSEKMKIDFSKFFDKKTGLKITEKEYHAKVKRNKKFTIEKVINAKGKIEKYLFTGNVKNNITKRDVTKRAEIGEAFPDFKLRTIDDKKIELANLKGKVVLLRFELFADNFRFKKQEIVSLDKQIHRLGKDNFEAIIIYISNRQDILKGFDIKNSNFKLVANGMNFHERYKITRYPTTIIIDSNGNLEGYFKKSEEIDLFKIIKR